MKYFIILCFMIYGFVANAQSGDNIIRDTIIIFDPTTKKETMRIVESKSRVTNAAPIPRKIEKFERDAEGNIVVRDTITTFDTKTFEETVKVVERRYKTLEELDEYNRKIESY